MKAHKWGKIGRFEVCKVCCRLRANVEDKPCRGPSPMREVEKPFPREAHPYAGHGRRR